MAAWDEIFLVLWVIKEEGQLQIVEQEFSCWCQSKNWVAEVRARIELLKNLVSADVKAGIKHPIWSFEDPLVQQGWTNAEGMIS